MKREDWDRRYGTEDLVWPGEPNVFVEAEAAGLPAGRALDVACGEGRNAIWLAGRGWEVTGLDFSAVALAKGRRLAAAAGVAVHWAEADATTWSPPGRFDLVVLCYLQLPDEAMRATLARLVPALAPGGTLLVVGHDARNLAGGVGGPRDPAVLLDPERVALALDGLVVERAETVERPVPGDHRPALDTLVRAHRPR